MKLSNFAERGYEMLGNRLHLQYLGEDFMALLTMFMGLGFFFKRIPLQTAITVTTWILLILMITVFGYWLN